MRKITSFLLCLCLLSVPVLALEPLPEDTFDLPCTAAILTEKETGTILYEKNAYEHLSPASVTKVMTLLLIAEAVENGSLSPEETVTASTRASSMGGSQVWLREGEQMSVSEMTKCVAVVSANDCAVALAEHLCGSEDAFVARMNERAAELGLEDTHFTNCTGLFEDSDHYTCAHDVAVIAREVLCHDFIRQFASIWTDSIREGSFGLTNTNRLVHYYEGCTGLKTGFTAKAMFCLAASAERQGVEYIAVILHGETSQLRFDAARTLLDYAFANYTLLTPAPDGELPVVPVTMGTKESVGVVCTGGGAVLTEKASAARITQNATLPESIKAPVEAGDVLGELVLSDGDKVIARLPLVSAESVRRLGLGAIWLGLVKTLCTGE